MADLSHLGGLNPIDTQDLENGIYADQKERKFQLPPRGRYLLRVTDTFNQASFGRTKAGALSVSIDPSIASGPFEGFTLKFTKVSAKPFKRDGAVVSQAGDLLRATGFSGKLTTEQDVADAIEATAGQTFEADIDWRAYSKSGFSLQGMGRFPKNADGTYQSWVEDPVLVDDEGHPVRVRANLIIDRFVPKAQ